MKDSNLVFQSSEGKRGGSMDSCLTDEGLISKTYQNVDLDNQCEMSSGSNITISSSECSSGLNSPQELGASNFSIQHSPTSFFSSLGLASVPQKLIADESAMAHLEHQRSQWEWPLSYHDTTTVGSENEIHHSYTREGLEQASQVEIEKLKAELSDLVRNADVMELELQTLRKQTVKETKRAQKLSEENSSLKEERDTLKEECERQKAFKVNAEGGDLHAVVVELRQELNHEKELNTNLRLQLQKMQESNSELVLAVKDLDEMLKQKITKASTTAMNEDEDQRALVELIKGQRDAEDPSQLEQKINKLYREIDDCRRGKDELEMQMEQLALDYEIVRQKNHELSSKWEQILLQEQLKTQYQCVSCLTNISEAETQSQMSEIDLKNKSEDLLDSLKTMNELKTRISCLEQELEKQAVEYEACLEDLTHTKVEQEQRAIRAEENLRKMRWKYATVAEKMRLKYANVAERLQDEFRSLSKQMFLTFEANKTTATKALAEAHELRMQKTQLEEMLQKVSEDLLSVGDGYNAEKEELSREIKVKAHLIEQMKLEIDDKSKQLELQKNGEEKDSRNSSQEMELLKSEIIKLNTENKYLSEQEENLRTELKKTKELLAEVEVAMQNGNSERNEMVSTIASLKKDVEESRMELSSLRHMKDEREIIIQDDMKNSLSEDKLEKGKSRKQASKLKSDVKKETALTQTEKKRNGRTVISDGKKGSPRSIKPAQVASSNKELAILQEKIKLLEGEIQSKQATLESTRDLFLQRERDLQTKIEQLESRLGRPQRDASSFNRDSSDNVMGAEDVDELNPTNVAYEDMDNLTRHTQSMQDMPTENGSVTCGKGEDEVFPEKEATILGSGYGECDNCGYLLTESELLRERNHSMEFELKDLQDRYSEISLKFAEVEGERQQLMMALRNLKNGKSS